MTTTMTRVPLCLALLGFLSVVWTLNPDDPNVCSHWERSVTPPLETSGDCSDSWQNNTSAVSLKMTKRKTNNFGWVSPQNIKGKKWFDKLAKSSRTFIIVPLILTPELPERLNAETCSDENFMNPLRDLNYTRKQFVCWEQTTRATFISTHPAYVFVFTRYYSHDSLCGHLSLQWKKKRKKKLNKTKWSRNIFRRVKSPSQCA